MATPPVPPPEVDNGFKSQTWPRAISFLTHDIPPPSTLYFTLEDQLRTTIYNTVANIEVDITVRILLPNGQIVPNVFKYNPAADSLPHNFDTTLAEGFILSVVATTPTSAVQRGQCFVQVVVTRGPAASAFIHEILVQDYVGTNQWLTWPGNNVKQSIEGAGVTEVVAVTTPAAGADFSYIVPTNHRQRIIAMSFQFQTSAAVATRSLTFEFFVGTTLLYGVDAPETFTASTGGYFNLSNNGAGLVIQTTGVLTPKNYLIPIPAGIIVTQGMQIRSQSLALQAADQYSNIGILVEDWILPQ